MAILSFNIFNNSAVSSVSLIDNKSCISKTSNALLALSNPSSQINLSTPNKNVKVVLQRILVYVCISEEDIGLSEDCLGLEEFIEESMHMDYVEELGYCKDSIHHYYSDAKAAFNLLNLHQRTLFTENEAYQLEWDRLSAWAQANGESLNSSYQLAKSNDLHFANQKTTNQSTVFVIIVVTISIVSLATLLIIKKRKQIR